MKEKQSQHSFHIPVMGIGFTIDTPLKVGKFGISSVVSLVDDMLMEKMREMYCKKTKKPFDAITAKMEDFRAKRITSYLNFLDQSLKENMEDMRHKFMEKKEEIEKYFDLLPDATSMKQQFIDFLNSDTKIDDMQAWLKENLIPGDIDVNIMTKLDKENFDSEGQLPTQFNDAHAALRGFAQSNLSSSVVLSAGMNPRLFGYFEKFEDFFPNNLGELKKKIILKVSDFRSAFIQGKMLAKKGLWVSEYRIESGLNCGGHAFGSEGFLLGPVLEEFKQKKISLKQSLEDIYFKALQKKGIEKQKQEMKITAQGGVGTAKEHHFLLQHYQLDSVGWGTPFLLAKDVVSIDDATVSRLIQAKDEDLYLSDISPLGIPFRNLRTNTKDIEKQNNISAGSPGHVCIKKYGAVNKEFTDHSICTASKQYQQFKLSELETKKLSPEEYKNEFNKITDKSCICVGLGTASLLVNELDTTTEGNGVSVCPGPNVEYFQKEENLTSITNHIYGKEIISLKERSNFMIKELELYLEYFNSRVLDVKDNKYANKFLKNVSDGITYYKELFDKTQDFWSESKLKVQHELNEIEKQVKQYRRALES